MMYPFDALGISKVAHNGMLDNYYYFMCANRLQKQDRIG